MPRETIGPCGVYTHRVYINMLPWTVRVDVYYMEDKTKDGRSAKWQEKINKWEEKKRYLSQES